MAKGVAIGLVMVSVCRSVQRVYTSVLGVNMSVQGVNMSVQGLTMMFCSVC